MPFLRSRPIEKTVAIVRQAGSAGGTAIVTMSKKRTWREAAAVCARGERFGIKGLGSGFGALHTAANGWCRKHQAQWCARGAARFGRLSTPCWDGGQAKAEPRGGSKPAGPGDPPADPRSPHHEALGRGAHARQHDGRPDVEAEAGHQHDGDEL